MFAHPLWQANVFWQSLAHARAAAGATPILWLNVDETSVRVHPRVGPGLVVGRQHWQGAQPKASIRKADYRAAVTYIGLICSEREIQPTLPQVILGSTQRFPQKLLRQLFEADLANIHYFENVHFWARSSSWQTAETFKCFLELLADALLPWRASFYPVLLLDCAPSHIAECVMKSAQSLRLRLVFIPASVGAVCQPLDIAGFSPLKAWLAREYNLLRESAERGLVTPIAWARLLARAGVEFWATKQWQQAFFAVGVRGQACDLSSDILQRVPLAAHGVAGVPQPPSRAESMAIWPRNRRMAYAYDLLFHV